MPVISSPQEFNTDDLYVDLRAVIGSPLYLKCEGFNFAGSGSFSRQRMVRHPAAFPISISRPESPITKLAFGSSPCSSQALLIICGDGLRQPQPSSSEEVGAARLRVVRLVRLLSEMRSVQAERHHRRHARLRA